MVTMLTGMVDRPVIDKTGLKGDYDFAFIWPVEAGTDGEATDNMITALQKQLGLKMEPAKMPVEMLIVVSALKVPVEN
jgi:uncharacterized protein (TIGR03435 family)